MVDGASLLGTRVPHTTTEHSTEATSAAEELCEEIFGTHATGTATTFKTLLAQLIIDGPLLGVGQNFVRFGDVLERFGRLWVVGVLVCTGNKVRILVDCFPFQKLLRTRVVLEGTLLVGSLQLSLSGGRVNLGQTLLVSPPDKRKHS